MRKCSSCGTYGKVNKNQSICPACQSVKRRARYSARRDEERAQVKKWQQANASYRSSAARNRRAGLSGAVSEKDWQEVLKTLGNKCLKCGGQPVTKDHVIPLSKRGDDHIDNLQPLCGPCNSSKGVNIKDYRLVRA